MGRVTSSVEDRPTVGDPTGADRNADTWVDAGMLPSWLTLTRPAHPPPCALSRASATSSATPERS
jgi:hypothetical protein